MVESTPCAARAEPPPHRPGDLVGGSRFTAPAAGGVALLTAAVAAGNLIVVPSSSVSWRRLRLCEVDLPYLDMGLSSAEPSTAGIRAD
jgi:hypothetical protein